MADLITVRQAGLAAVQDLGRPGYERAGIPVNGAADQYSAAIANTLVGNREQDPLIEITATGFALEASRPVLIALTGAPANVTVGDRSARQWEPLCVGAGELVRINRIHDGLRVYLAINGLIDATRVLGSCAPDPLLEVGTPLTAGSQLTLASAYQPFDHPVFRHPLFRLGAVIPRFGTAWTIDVASGPEVEEFDDTLETLCQSKYVVSPRSNHIGLRLGGPMPVRTTTEEILSRGVPIGAIEVPPSHELLLLMRGRPVTAGYPVIAVATRSAQSALGQVAPGHTIRFRAVSVVQAAHAARDQRHLQNKLAHRVRVVFREVGIPTRLSHERTAS